MKLLKGKEAPNFPGKIQILISFEKFRKTQFDILDFNHIKDIGTHIHDIRGLGHRIEEYLYAINNL